MKQCLAAVVLSLVLPAVTLAQNPTTQTLSKLPTNVAGPLYGFAPRQADRVATPSSNSPQKKTRVRHPVLLGAAIGAGAGFVINAAACRTGESVCTSGGNVLMAGIGAGIGAAIGAVLSR